MKSFSEKTPSLILGIIFGIFASTFIVIWFSYGLSCFAFSFIDIKPKTSYKLCEKINHYFSLPLQPILSTDQAVLAGLLAGFFVRWLKFLKTPLEQIYQKTSFIFRVFFIPLLPVYVFGFLAKLKFEGSLLWMIKTYSNIFATTLFIIVSYLFLFYAVSFRARFLRAIKNMLPAGFMGFCTSSSAVTMPLTIECVQKNINDRSFSQFIIPTTVNMHLTADNINNVLSCIALLLMSGLSVPTPFVFLKFSFFYLLTSLSFAAVPGGIALIMLPVLEKHLGLPSDAFPLYITIMAVMDPFLTAGNVMGNGAFSKMIFNFLRPNFSNEPSDKINM